MSTKNQKSMETNTPIVTSKWYDNKFVVALLCVFFFPVGLYGLWKSDTIKKGWKIAVTLIFVLMFIGVVSSPDKKGSSATNSSSSSTRTAQVSESAKPLTIGDVLHTEYFDVTVNKAGVSERVNTGNEFSDLKKEDGTQYLVMNVTFKNTDNESRMITEGSVWINYNGKDYEYDKSETIMADGWGLFLDQINPLTSKTTNLVYKIPTELKGAIYWQPGRANENQRVLIGTVGNEETATK